MGHLAERRSGFYDARGGSIYCKNFMSCMTGLMKTKLLASLTFCSSMFLEGLVQSPLLALGDEAPSLHLCTLSI